jgi:hypothetical protein
MSVFTCSAVSVVVAINIPLDVLGGFFHAVASTSIATSHMPSTTGVRIELDWMTFNMDEQLMSEVARMANGDGVNDGVEQLATVTTDG